MESQMRTKKEILPSPRRKLKVCRATGKKAHSDFYSAILHVKGMAKRSRRCWKY